MNASRLAGFFLAGTASLLCAQAAAQGMYKCKDAAGKITYSGSECKLLGLTSAGEVTGRVSVTPALQFKPPPPSAAPAAPAAAPAPAVPEQPADGDAPDPNKRCFTIKTAKGTATRCNDRPD
jgi:hypothetical protein